MSLLNLPGIDIHTGDVDSFITDDAERFDVFKQFC
jgi:hypothetical protein